MQIEIDPRDVELHAIDSHQSHLIYCGVSIAE